MGDYTNLSVQLDLDLTGQGGLPGLPELPPVCEETPLAPVCDSLPDPVETLTDIEKCLRSGNPASDICSKVLRDVDLLRRLREECQKPANAELPVCRAVNAAPGPTLPDPGQLPIPPLPPAPAPPLPSIPGLGLGRVAFGSSDAGGGDDVSADKRYDDELAPLLVWGMVER
jgi:phospholipid/cholesterol/gamma-HCH transport system substrate-binding protein